jgi:RNA polymerase sigma factor (sigma-70 family)
MSALHNPHIEFDQDCYVSDEQPSDSDEILRAFARKLVRQEISYVHNRAFEGHQQDVDSNDAVFRMLERSRDQSTRTSASNTLDRLPAHLARLCENDLLTAEEERSLFRCMNLFKFRANQYRSRIDPEHPNRAEIKKAQMLLGKAQAIRDHLIKANLRLVISIARKFVTPKNPFDDLFSDGVIALMYAVEKFDYDRGFRFSTYAYSSISRSLYRTVNKRRLEPAQLDCLGGTNSVEDQSRSEIADHQEQRHRELLSHCVNQLDRRERFILRSRSALGAHRKKRTCRELGERLGISRERVRQIELRAVSKIEKMIADDVDDCRR